jgi:phosphoglycolate phosphatase-like HAD superfamily hydrolase
MYLMLFDIDGTLIDSGEAGSRSLNLSFAELFSIRDAFHGISMAGKTDTEIIKEGMLKHGISIDGNLNAAIYTYLRHLRREIDNERRHLKPGIYELLEELTIVKDIQTGLLTGNIEPGARIKLDPFDLNKYFPTGAFGSDDEDRNKLLPIALKRFEERCRRKIRVNECLIVGDTPRDVQCAKINEARSLGVATGPYSIDELKEAGADYVMKDLSSYEILFRLLNI